MGLVEYSDSESEGESVPASAPAPKAQPQPAAKTGFQKAAPGKIQVNLPSVKPEPGQDGDAPEGPPAKRARTGGAFSGFNALLPAPKKTAQNAPKQGVNLKTSSEAAFSRNPAPQTAEENAEDTYNVNLGGEEKVSEKEEPPAEPKFVGKVTRFLPLSVSGKKKKKPVTRPTVSDNTKGSTQGTSESGKSTLQGVITELEPPKPKPKKSLFSVQAEEEATPEAGGGEYQPITIERSTVLPSEPEGFSAQSATTSDPNSLEAVAADMNLTPAQRRQLFGRQSKDANVMHFNLDAEYRHNEAARLAGEVVEHKAVKSIAPGKHSLQQLVNNARTQQDGLQDKWAEGRRNRGEGGSKYGWTS